MGIIAERDRRKLVDLFDKSLVNPVRLIVFTQESECAYCKETRELMLELSNLTPKISTEVYDFVQDSAKAQEHGVDKIPATLVFGKKEYKLRFFGLPTGYEFGVLIDDIIDASRGYTQLSEDTKRKLKNVDKPIHIQVFVTPTCPYCPKAVRLAHQMAIESELVKADMVESIEFPHLAQKYSVMAVPKIVVNEALEFVGALPEETFVEHVLHALKPHYRVSPYG